MIVTHYGGPDALQVVEEECPEPERRFPLAEARRAHELLGEGGVTGKIVLVCDGH
jgi:hypothetical protein